MKKRELYNNLYFLGYAKDRTIAYAIDHAKKEDLQFLMDYYFSLIDNQISNLDKEYDLALSISKKDVLNGVICRTMYEILNDNELKISDKKGFVRELINNINMSNEQPGIVRDERNYDVVEIENLFMSKTGIKRTPWEIANNDYAMEEFINSRKDAPSPEIFFGENVCAFYDAYIKRRYEEIKALLVNGQYSDFNNISKLKMLPYDKEIIEQVRASLSYIESHKDKAIEAKSTISDASAYIESPETMSPEESKNARNKLIALIVKLYEHGMKLPPNNEILEIKQNPRAALDDLNITDEEIEVISGIIAKCKDYNVVLDALRKKDESYSNSTTHSMLHLAAIKIKEETDRLMQLKDAAPIEEELSDLRFVAYRIQGHNAEFVNIITKEHGLDLSDFLKTYYGGGSYQYDAKEEDYVKNEIIPFLYDYEKYDNEVWQALQESGILEDCEELKNVQNRKSNVFTQSKNQGRINTLIEQIRSKADSIVHSFSDACLKKIDELAPQLPYTLDWSDENHVLYLPGNELQYINSKRELEKKSNHLDARLTDVEDSLSEHHITKDEILFLSGIKIERLEKLFPYIADKRHIFSRELDEKIAQEYEMLDNKTLSPVHSVESESLEAPPTPHSR